MAVTSRYFAEFGKHAFHHITALQKTTMEEFMQKSIVFLVRVQCRRKESSRSLSHLLMSFLWTLLMIATLKITMSKWQHCTFDNWRLLFLFSFAVNVNEQWIIAQLRWCVNFTTVACRISSQLNWHKNYQNRLRLAKVIVKNATALLLTNPKQTRQNKTQNTHELNHGTNNVTHWP